MSKVCDLCGKRPRIGNAVSHSHTATKRRFLPNLKSVRVKKAGTSKRITVCMKCLKSQKDMA